MAIEKVLVLPLKDPGHSCNDLYRPLEYLVDVFERVCANNRILP